MASLVKAKDLLFVGSVTNCEFKSTLKGEKSHEIDTQWPKKTVYPLKFKISINRKFNFNFAYPCSLQHSDTGRQATDIAATATKVSQQQRWSWRGLQHSSFAAAQGNASCIPWTQGRQEETRGSKATQ